MMTNDKDRENFLPGLKPVLELLERDPERVDMVYVRKGRASTESARLLDLCREYGVRFSLVNEETLTRMADRSGHQGVIARLREASFMPWESLLEQAVLAPLPLIVALDQVQDPGNVGTILRTADAAGFDGAILGPGCADLYGAKTLRATMGSVFRVPVLPTNDLPGTLEAMKREGYAVAATELGGQDFYACCPRGKAILVIGSEGQGISKPVRGAATHHLALPMRGGAESLNAAVAAGIMIYEMAREQA